MRVIGMPAMKVSRLPRGSARAAVACGFSPQADRRSVRSGDGYASNGRPDSRRPLTEQPRCRRSTDVRPACRRLAREPARRRAQAQDAGQLNVICSVQAEWCNMIQTVFARTTGIKVNMSLKGSGEALAQLIAEKANPKTDVWFGGTGDPHLQAAEQGLTLEYKIADAAAAARLGAAAGAQSRLQDGGHLQRPAGLRLQHRAAREEEAAGAEDLGRPAEARSTRARSRSPTRPPAAPPTRWSPRWCS